ncbi:unnamed protein product [Closterium sp. NIES-54]
MLVVPLTAVSAATAATAAMASPTVLTFDAEGRAVDFDVWVDDMQLFLQCDSKDGVYLLPPLTRGFLLPACPTVARAASPPPPSPPSMGMAGRGCEGVADVPQQQQLPPQLLLSLSLPHFVLGEGGELGGSGGGRRGSAEPGPPPLSYLPLLRVQQKGGGDLQHRPPPPLILLLHLSAAGAAVGGGNGGGGCGQPAVA